MRVVVTGASGLVGQRIVESGKAIGLDILPVRRQAPCDTLNPFPDLRRGDVLIHLAQPAASHAVDHIMATRAVAAFAKLLERDWTAVVYASSVSVYGRLQGHITETSPVVRAQPYAVMKLDCEALCLDNGGTALRVANVLASEPTPGTVMADILSQIPGRGPISVRNAEAKVDLVWIEDVVAAFFAAVRRRVPGLFNVASGQTHSVKEIACAARAGADEIDRQIESKISPIASDNFQIDISNIATSLGWAPRRDALEAVASLARQRTERA